MKLIDDEIAQLDRLVQNETAYTFDVDLIRDLALNMTMTKAPVLERGSNKIKFNFDGTFNKMQTAGYRDASTQLPDHDYFPDISNTHH